MLSLMRCSNLPITLPWLCYIGTPVYVAGLWKRKDIDALEASLYRIIFFLPNTISNKAILNTMTSIRLAGEAIGNLAQHTKEEADRHKKINSYFEK